MPNYRSILLIQEDSADAAAISTALSKTTDAWTQVIWAKTLESALRHLADADSANGIVAVLLDLFLPDSRGIDTFDRIFARTPETPVLVLCVPEDEHLARQAVQKGAHDYLLKARLDDYLLPKALANIIDRAANAEALFTEKERAEVMLNSIGDAVMCCDVAGRVTYLNLVAEKLTGWTRADAAGLPVEEVFRIVDGTTREVASNPMAAAIRGNKTVLLEPNSILSRRDGVEAAIEDSAAPIHDRRGHVTGAVMVFHDVSSTRALSLKISHQAQHDSLTDLPNRILLHDRLTQGMALAHRHSQKLAVMFLDVDRFKNVNDSLGHDIGDRLLILMAQRLLSCVRTTDTVSRQGGDEFVILLPELSRGQDAAIRAERILAALSAPYDIDSHTVHFTASIGIVIFPDDGRDPGTLLKNADFAMYHAKECGRSNYQFFREDMNVRALERQAIEEGLRRAVEFNELVLHYQPILDLWSGAPTGIEALLRWRHPTRGLLLPGQFITIAEESGLIVPIGRWVLGEACRQIRIWEAFEMPPMRIAINVSAAELRDRDFVAQVRRTLAENQVAPNKLEFELTETFLMQDSSSTAMVLRELKKLGVRLALDDFGTGYSSLSHLKGFPIDTLKIDRAFVNEITTNAGDASIVRAVIALGNSLQIRVVAEGVESAGQLAKLQDFRCPEGQGHYFSRAVPGDEVRQLLRKLVTDMRAFAEGATGEIPDLQLAAKRMKKSLKTSSRRNIRN
ncbi:MAG TPA: EAL domain-containing protein [Steroidobacteraceae bacterium]|nr:EAL domain-containing protein [Steroidobacteraceae bacterium]